MLYVVGIGPGNSLDRTHRAEQAIARCEVVVGYKLYLEHIQDLTVGKEVYASGMTKERERCAHALAQAEAGRSVALVSSGDPGVYGMAGLAIEMAQAMESKVMIRVIPGVTSATAAAASLGAPLMLDFACISLSDLLVPWDKIENRLEAAALGDFVVALYNPRSKRRVEHLHQAQQILLQHRSDDTPVGVVTRALDDSEQIDISDLVNFLDLDIGMRSLVIIGNSTSKRQGNWLITPRGYQV